jgi:hypothetical protein
VGNVGRGVVCSVGGWSVAGCRMWWGGGQPAVVLALEPPATLVDRAVVGPAQQDQVDQVGGAAVQPVDQMMGVTPGQGPLAVGEPTAPVAHRQGDPLGAGHDPAGPPDLQRLAGAPPSVRGSRAVAARSQLANLSVPPVSPVAGLASPRWSSGP